MLRKAIINLLAAMISAGVVYATPALAARAERVVLISIDGLTAEDAANLGRLDAHTPTLNALVANGVRAKSVVPTTPASTFPNHVTMVTGVSAATHGVLDSDVAIKCNIRE